MQDENSDILPVLLTKEQRRAFYDKIAGFYDLMAEAPERPMREAGLELLAAARGEHVLELGFGTGHCLVSLAAAVGPSGRVYGIDISERMRELAERLIAERGLTDRVELTRGDGQHLPYEAGSMHGVFMSFTLELFDTPEIPEVLAECRRVLRDGGRLAVVAVSKEGKQGLVVKAFEWTHRHFPNLMDCRPIHARASIEAAGFEIARAEQRRMWVPVEIVLATKPRNDASGG